MPPWTGPLSTHELDNLNKFNALMGGGADNNRTMKILQDTTVCSAKIFVLGTWKQAYFHNS